MAKLDLYFPDIRQKPLRTANGDRLCVHYEALVRQREHLPAEVDTQVQMAAAGYWVIVCDQCARTARDRAYRLPN